MCEIKICQLEICKKKFIPKRKTTKYCSLGCLKISRRIIKKCQAEGCGCTLPAGSSSVKFCSRICYLNTIRPYKKCHNNDCNNHINYRHNSKFCSMSCYRQEGSKNVIHYYNCQKKECYNVLSKAQFDNMQKYCSSKCCLDDKKEKSIENIGNIYLRKVKRWNYPRRFIKTKNGFILLSKYIWEKVNGPIPKHHYIVYKDGNTFNDEDINNLSILHISESPKILMINKEDMEVLETETVIKKEFFNIKEFVII